MSTMPILYRAAQVRALDAEAIRLSGEDGYVLMQRAAAAAWQRARERWPQARRLLVCAGPGNNGGDALELGRLALAEGLAVDMLLLADPQRLRGEAAQAYQAWLSVGGEVSGAGALAACLPQADLIVDGLLGTGLDRPVGEEFARIIEAVNRVSTPVLALDLPSGLAADTGVVMGCAIRADLTVSFIGRKRGLYTGAALDHVGELDFDGLAVDPASYAACSSDERLLQAQALADWLPPRPRDAHKGQFGHVLVIGGAPGYSGAIRMCGQAALRSGAGLVSVLTHPDCVATVAQAQPELMVRGAWHPGEQAADVLLSKASVLALGPGLGLSGWSESWLEVLDAGRPTVLDADALNLLPEDVVLGERCVITPHPGEAARLLGCSTGEVQGDRYAAAVTLAARLSCVVVLKGAGSIVALPSGQCWVCPYGNPGMSVGGMGDVLTGVIAAFLGQGLAPPEAACAGVLAHALAGDVAARAGQRGLLPSDVLAALREVVNP